MNQPQAKLPHTESTDIPRLARQAAWLMFGLAGLMLFLLILIASLAAGQGEPVNWVVITGWLVILIAWPAAMGLGQWRRYRQACELERDHLYLPGKVIGFAYEQIGSLEAAPITDVYWVIFALYDDYPIKQKVSLETYQRLKVGDRIEVKTLSRDRHICRAELT